MALSSPDYRIIPHNVIERTMRERGWGHVESYYDISMDHVAVRALRTIPGALPATGSARVPLDAFRSLGDAIYSIDGQLRFGQDWYDSYERALAIHTAYISR